MNYQSDFAKRAASTSAGSFNRWILAAAVIACCVGAIGFATAVITGKFTIPLIGEPAYKTAIRTHLKNNLPDPYVQEVEWGTPEIVGADETEGVLVDDWRGCTGVRFKYRTRTAGVLIINNEYFIVSTKGSVKFRYPVAGEP